MTGVPTLDGSYELAACIDCGKTLTIEEDHFYTYRCGKCEGVWDARLTDWRNGAPDPELDRMFG